MVTVFIALQARPPTPLPYSAPTSPRPRLDHRPAQDVEEGMGPTVFLPRTHGKTAVEEAVPPV